MNWNNLDHLDQIQEIKTESSSKFVMIFKHSTRCSISSMALNRLERDWNDPSEESIKPYILDLIAYRQISNKLAEEFGVYHQSPQVLLIKDGKCIFNDSHMGISYQALKKEVAVEVR